MPNADVLKIVFEDDHLLVVDKPSGMPSQPAKTAGAPSALDLALAHAPAICATRSRNPHAPAEHGLVHRLDVETSGLLVFAKSNFVLDRLLEQWTTGAVVKIYRALVPPAPHPTLPWTIAIPIAHHPKSARRMVALTAPNLSHRGNPQHARTTLLARASGMEICATLRALNPTLPHIEARIQITTGFRHQIRCHLPAGDLPILGDRLYPPPGPLREACPRLALHAAAREFFHPRDAGRKLVIESL